MTTQDPEPDSGGVKRRGRMAVPKRCTILRTVNSAIGARDMAQAMEECGGEPYAIVFAAGEWHEWNVFGRMDLDRVTEMQAAFDRLKRCGDEIRERAEKARAENPDVKL